MKAGVKRFFAYLFVILAIFIAIVLICFAILFFSPGTEILGYEYVRLTNSIDETVLSTDLSVQNAHSLKLVTNNGNINVRPNVQSEDLRLLYSQNVSGITRSTTSDYSMNIDYSNELYAENSGSYKSLVIEIVEPSGFTINSNSTITVLLPANFNFDIVYLSSDTGNVTYDGFASEEGESAYSSVSDLYISTKEHGSITINNTTNLPNDATQISNYNFNTVNGTVSFSYPSLLAADSVTFNTNSGRFNYTNENSDASMNLTNGLKINASGNPSIYINSLQSRLEIQSQGGTFNFSQIGSDVLQSEVILNLNNSTFNARYVYGFVSLMSQDDEVSNNVNITELTNETSSSNMFQVGTGSVKIETLKGETSFSSTSGSISASNIDVTSSIYAYSDTGQIDIMYNSSRFSMEDTLLTVFTREGGVNLTNVSARIDLEVLGDNANNEINITFTAISRQEDYIFENTINARNKNVNITLSGTSDDLIFRLFCSKDAEFSAVPVSRVQGGDLDYELDSDSYSGYSSQYRVGYDRPTTSAEYEGRGKLCINTTGNIRVVLGNL